MKTEPALHQAIIKNDELRIEEKDLDVNAINALGFSALEIASFLGREKWLKRLQPQIFERKLFLRQPHEKQSKSISLKQFEEHFDVHYLPYLLFSSYDRFKEVIAQCPWLLRGQWGAENRQVAIKFSQELKNGLMAPVEIRWIGEEIGYGLFARHDISAGAFIGEYTGIVHRLKRGVSLANDYCLHYPTKWWSLKYFAIDALTAGNETRFINHSNRANLQPVCAVDRNLLHFIFVAKEKIAAGTELTVDYGPDFWRRRQQLEK